MSARFDVNALKIASPCPARWEDMAGDERARFCRQCQKHVYNFSTMTSKEVETLVVEKEGNLCGRMARRMDGTVITADCPTGQAMIRRKRWQWAGGVVTGFALLVSALWLRANSRDNEAEEGRITTEMKERWYALKIQLGLEKPPMALPGAIVMPINLNPNPTVTTSANGGNGSRSGSAKP
ncbi:MAG: hypothetical protein K0Q55_899 [Verrucomicrobia bacterium]|jgi:hypothetical protein|nr:hypothetical protein [Verrucomicrobiota bacterium]